MRYKVITKHVKHKQQNDRHISLQNHFKSTQIKFYNQETETTRMNLSKDLILPHNRLILGLKP